MDAEVKLQCKHIGSDVRVQKNEPKQKFAGLGCDFGHLEEVSDWVSLGKSKRGKFNNAYSPHTLSSPHQTLQIRKYDDIVKKTSQLPEIAPVEDVSGLS